ncbi:histone-lysine N-methyltransferase SUV39H2-like isoform X3 [Photinus pyralis]|nr:histone-lysine N-methyltransferase SUV39H2-like isoform X3 [Photinus pyralis]
MFRVKWLGWSEECNTWEPFHHLDHCPEKLQEFFTSTLNQSVLDSVCQTFSVSQDLSDKALESLIPPQGFSALRSFLDVQRDILTLFSAPPLERHVKKMKRGKETVLLYFLLLKRERQILKLNGWEESINKTASKSAVIKVENNCDLEDPPEGFIYVNEYVPMEGISIPNEPPIGCECESCGPKEKSCCGKNYSWRYTYNDKQKLNVPKGTPIYECNKMCKCGDDCRNRVVQKDRTIPLCIFRTSNGCGWGVKTLRKISAGEFVCEYVGEVITHDEAEKRGEIYDAAGRTYLFDLDFNMSDNPYTVDAATYGNISHFINHSCSPNLGVWAVWINCLDPNIPKLALFALREIPKDEELTFDYMSGNKVRSSKKNKDQGGESEHTLSPGRARLDLFSEGGQKNRPVCKCSAKSCRRYLF